MIDYQPSTGLRHCLCRDVSDGFTYSSTAETYVHAAAGCLKPRPTVETNLRQLPAPQTDLARFHAELVKPLETGPGPSPVLVLNPEEADYAKAVGIPDRDIVVSHPLPESPAEQPPRRRGRPPKDTKGYALEKRDDADRWCVIRQASGEIVASGLTSKAKATAHMDDLIRKATDGDSPASQPTAVELPAAQHAADAPGTESTDMDGPTPGHPELATPGPTGGDHLPAGAGQPAGPAAGGVRADLDRTQLPGQDPRRPEDVDQGGTGPAVPGPGSGGDQPQPDAAAAALPAGQGADRPEDHREGVSGDLGPVHDGGHQLGAGPALTLFYIHGPQGDCPDCFARMDWCPDAFTEMQGGPPMPRNPVAAETSPDVSGRGGLPASAIPLGSTSQGSAAHLQAALNKIGSTCPVHGPLGVFCGQESNDPSYHNPDGTCRHNTRDGVTCEYCGHVESSTASSPAVDNLRCPDHPVAQIDCGTCELVRPDVVAALRRNLPTAVIDSSRPSLAAFMSAAKHVAQSGNTPWAARYANELRQIVIDRAENAPRNLQRHLGPSEIGVPCLSGDTEVVTREGIRRIKDLAKEGSAELLIPLLYEGSEVRKRWGKFQRVPVECFGEQEVYEVTLRRRQAIKVVFATADHRWFRSYYSGKQKKQQRLETTGLRPGHRMTPLRRARPKTTTLMPVAVAQGFIFGDGTSGSNDDRHRPASLQLHHNGKDEALLPYFPEEYFPGDRKTIHESHRAFPFTVIKGLPRSWKHLPPIDESVSFLMSWLAGYFAADGTVSEDGHCTISSAYEAHLKFVQSAAAICGIGYGQVYKYMRRGISGDKPAPEETPLYRMSLRRADLPDWFFLTARHAQRAATAALLPERESQWVVESVKATGRTEPVYCAITGDVGAFALADDLMTGNCDRQVVGKLVGFKRTNHVTDPWPSIMGTAGHAWMEDTFRGHNDALGWQRWLVEQRVTPHPDHAGTSDLYDAANLCVDDHKFLGETPMAKLRADKVPPQYFFQLLTYRRGYQLMGLRVDRIVIIGWPRTGSTVDGMYVWEKICTPEDDVKLDTLFARMQWRKQWAAAISAGNAKLSDVPAVPDPDDCYFCPFYRPQAARDGGPGCPGHAGM